MKSNVVKDAAQRAKMIAELLKGTDKGVLRKDIYHLFGNDVSKDDLDAALEEVRASGWGHQQEGKSETGRRVVVWLPGPGSALNLPVPAPQVQAPKDQAPQDQAPQDQPLQVQSSQLVKAPEVKEVFTAYWYKSPIRVVIISGEPWYVGADVAAVLGYARTENALAVVPDSAKGTALISTLGGPQELSVVSKKGLFFLTMKSNKSEAQKFNDWLVEQGIAIVEHRPTRLPAGEEDPSGQLASPVGGRKFTPDSLREFKRGFDLCIAAIIEQAEELETTNGAVRQLQEVSVEHTRQLAVVEDKAVTAAVKVLNAEAAKAVREEVARHAEPVQATLDLPFDLKIVPDNEHSRAILSKTMSAALYPLCGSLIPTQEVRNKLMGQQWAVVDLVLGIPDDVEVRRKRHKTLTRKECKVALEHLNKRFGGRLKQPTYKEAYDLLRDDEEESLS